MANESNRHHFTPRSVLRRFAPDVERSFVHVFDKTSGRVWEAGLGDAGAGKGYNTLQQPDGTRLNFEGDFDTIDADYARVGNILAEQRSLNGLDDAFLRTLADVTAAQHLRTPRVRITLSEIPRQLDAELRERGWPSLDGEMPSDDEVRQITRDLIAKRQKAANLLLAKDILLFEPAEQKRFWTSDHPVALHSQLPLGEVGLDSLGVEIYLPIAADLAVGFVCPSQRSATVLQLAGGVERRVLQASIIAQGEPLRISDATVNFFNALQVQASERFLYASRDDFELARKILAGHPKLAEPRGLIRAGKMGQAPPRPGNLPAGQWLYLETNHDYLLIPIRDWSTCNGGREMTTDDRIQLTDAVGRERFEFAQVFADNGGEMMRGVKVEQVEGAASGRLRLLFADPALQDLDEAIARTTTAISL